MLNKLSHNIFNNFVDLSIDIYKQSAMHVISLECTKLSDKTETAKIFKFN